MRRGAQALLVFLTVQESVMIILSVVERIKNCEAKAQFLSLNDNDIEKDLRSTRHLDGLSTLPLMIVEVSVAVEEERLRI